jgi:hypothetical protein
MYEVLNRTVQINNDVDEPHLSSVVARETSWYPRVHVQYLKPT